MLVAIYKLLWWYRVDIFISSLPWTSTELLCSPRGINSNAYTWALRMCVYMYVGKERRIHVWGNWRGTAVGKECGVWTRQCLQILNLRGRFQTKKCWFAIERLVTFIKFSVCGWYTHISKSTFWHVCMLWMLCPAEQAPLELLTELLSVIDNCQSTVVLSWCLRNLKEVSCSFSFHLSLWWFFPE